MSTLTNPYWDAVRNRIDPTGSLWGTPSVDGIGRWTRVAEHVPVQWDGLHDIVHVYDRSVA